MIKPNYKVAICGAHSQGKTTLVNALKENILVCSELNFSFRTNLTRDLNKILPINEQGNNTSQYLVMARHLEFAITPGRWIMDRGALDGIAYSRYFYDTGNVDKSVMDAIETVYELCLPHYDKIFYIAPELSLKEDGQRSINKEFFDGVVEKFNFYINHFSVSRKIIFLTGSVQERVKHVVREIKNDFQDEL
jgi:nicotinamide riboside kinase